MKITVKQKRKTALQAHSRRTDTPLSRRSAAPRRRSRLKASLTVEAALVLPLFLFVLLLLALPFRMMTAERQVQRAAEEVCARAAQVAALRDEASTQYTASLGEQALKAARETVRDPNVSGLSAEHSSFLADGETVSVVLDYRYQIPIPLFRIPPLRRSCTATRRAWIGETDPENRLSETAADELVFIGRHSTRYHKSAHCHYLSNELSALSVEAARNARNAGGGRYHACPVCARAVTAGTVYIMPSGSAYHRDPACRAIRAYVRAVHLSEVRSLGPCSYCYR